ncbi:MAG: S41 family peptidase [Chitinophagales bacterium]|nr:S41 family peptidase [Chitinophagales bacterium]
MKNFLVIIVLLFATGFFSCKKAFVEPDIADNPKQNFEYLWSDINNRYAYLDYKGLDWNAIHSKYAEQVHDGISNTALFSILANMMNELRDDHSNLISPFNVSVYYPTFLNSPENYDDRLVLEHYLLRHASQYYITGPLLNTIIDTLGVRIGYIRYSSFSRTVSNYDIDFVINRFKGLNGVIIDVRNNGGGDVSNIFPLANRFFDTTRLGYTSQLKTGPGQNDFGDNENVYFGPVDAYHFTNRIAVLSNRNSFSATSLFCTAMKSLPYVKMVGDSTGGGMGAPNGGELPNGWTYRFSVSRALAPDGSNWESGVPADILVDLDPTLEQQGYDSIIERAIQYIISGK